MIYPANMLPQRSWKLILSQLDHHFGEPATVGATALAQIAEYLAQHASDAPDIPARDRHFMSELSSDITPVRITKTSWWNQMHADFDFEGIKRTKTKSASNCLGCHEDGVR